MEIIFFLSVLYLALSLVMGIFSVTQLNYQHRMTRTETFGRGILAFLKGFTAWVFYFPKGIYTNKYKVKVFHKVGNIKPFT